MLEFAWLPQPVADLLQKLLRKAKAKFEFGIVPIGLAILTIVLAVIGWSWRSFDGSFHSVVLIALKSLADFTPNVKNIDDGNKLTDASALCGILTLYSSAAVIVATVLRETRRKLAARLFGRGHVIVIGETKLAERAAKVWLPRDRHTLRIISPERDRPDWKSNSVRYELDESLVNGLSLVKARHVFLDLGEDGPTLALAFRLLSKIASDAALDGGETIDREWVIVGRDIDMADHFIAKVRDLGSGVVGSGGTVPSPLPRLHFLNPERLAARHQVMQRPLFLEAEKRGRRRIHVLIIGFAPVAWHLVEMTYLSGLTTALDPPLVTILTPQPDIQRRRFYSGRAALAEAIDVAFLEFDALDDFQTGEAEPGQLLRARAEKAPVTTIFSVLDDSDRNIRIAMEIDAIHRKTDRLDCPIFTLDDSGADETFLSAGGRFDQIIGGFSTFGLTDACLESELCDAEKRDVLPRALHARYIATLPPSSARLPAWCDLSETLRRANRNAAAHWLAKMHILGIDVGDLPSGVLPRLSDQDAERLLAMADAAAGTEARETFMQVAHCEHERWMIERRIDGWTLGDRDDRRQTHPLFVSWQTLVDHNFEEVLKDMEQVKALILCLREAGDPNVVLETKAGAETPE